MTTIASVTNKDGAWVAWDSQLCLGNTIIPNNWKKWTSGKGLWVGVSGDAHPLSCAKSAIKRWKGRGIDSFLARFREEMLESGYNTSSDTGAPSYGTGGLLVYKGTLYDFDSALTPGKIRPYKGSCFWASGSGSDYAVGSLYSLLPLGTPPPDALKVALRAAATYDAGSGPPFRVKRVG